MHLAPRSWLLNIIPSERRGGECRTLGRNGRIQEVYKVRLESLGASKSKEGLPEGWDPSEGYRLDKSGTI